MKVELTKLEKGETFLTPAQAAELLHTSPAHMANQRFRGEGVPFVRYGRKVLYPASLIQKHLEGTLHDPAVSLQEVEK